MPVGCDQIRVLGLPPEALNALGGAEPILNLPEGFALRYSKSREQLSTVNQIETEGVLGFTAPSTPVNDAVFCEYGTPATLDNSRRFYDVQVVSAGIPAPFTRLVCKGKDGEGNWDLELRRAPGHWVELSSNLALNQIDFGIASTNYLSIESNWEAPEYAGTFDPDENNCTYWPPMDYGGWVDLNEPLQGSTVPVKFISPSDIRPLLSLPYILKRGFCQIGWTIDGVIFDNPWFRRLWVYALSETYYDADTKGGRIKGRMFERREITDRRFRFTELVKGVTSQVIPNPIDLSTPAWHLGIKNTGGISLKYRFILKGSFHNDRALPFECTFQVMEIDPTDNDTYTGETISAPENEITVSFAPNEKKDVSFEIECILKPNQKGAISFPALPPNGFFVEKGLYFEVQPLNNCIMPGAGSIEVAKCVSRETNLLDWLKATMHLIRGRLKTDFKTKTLTIYPSKEANLYGDIVPGYLLEESPDVDYSEKVIEGSVKIAPINPTLKRFTRIEFADSTDAYISSLELLDPAHSKKINNGDELPNEIESIQNPFLQPTLEGQIEGIGSDGGGRAPTPFLPRMWDNTNGERSFAIAPRIFFAFGKVRQKNPSNKLAEFFPFCSFFWDNPVNIGDGPAFYPITEFGYATQLRTLDLDPTPTIDGNVVFSNQPANLFTQFYLGLTNENKGAFNLDFLAYLEPQDYANFDFRNLLRINYEGRPLRVEALEVSDHEMCGEIPTPIRGIVAPALTKCCDLPCGCQFTTCEYYQDFGLYLRQATLDTFRLASFVVDGIELITTPLPFGEINVADVDGDPFVTNLVDLLNSVGAPYFAFGISSRLDGDRGRRFFTIKKPACQSFKILITADGDEVYMYTQAEQAQKWFGSTWAPFGYVTTYSVPENCVITTEY